MYKVAGKDKPPRVYGRYQNICQELENLPQTIRIQNIEMEFGSQKWAMLMMENWKEKQL